VSAPSSETLAPAHDGRFATELAGGRLFAVGGRIALDGTASWAPAAATGYQSANAYLLLGEEALIVDPGLPCVAAAVMAGLKQAVPATVTPRVFLTRSQFDCIGNLHAVMTAHGVEDIFTGGLDNPFDSFDSATSLEAGGPAASRRVVERSPEESRLEIYSTPLRLLATFWGYDAETRTLFSSDSFTHVTVADLETVPVIRSGAEDPTTVEQVRAHLFATFWWLPYADKRAIASELRGFFASHPVEVLAPCRGGALVGADVVARHVELLLAVLDEAPRETLWR
jgi:hypothetical protein